MPAKEELEPEMVEMNSSNDPTTVKNAKQEMHEAEVLEGYLYNLSQKMRVKEEEFYDDAAPVYEDAPGVADTPKPNRSGVLGASCKAKAAPPSSSSASSSSSAPWRNGSQPLPPPPPPPKSVFEDLPPVPPPPPQQFQNVKVRGPAGKQFEGRFYEPWSVYHR